jgi:hypothetical protein
MFALPLRHRHTTADTAAECDTASSTLRRRSIAVLSIATELATFATTERDSDIHWDSTTTCGGGG